jgi:ribosomal protein S18 acetylase RimI-like enzyme
MLTFRTFRNFDPPAIVELWQNRAAASPTDLAASIELFEQLVFAKLYFDPAGMVLAHDNGRLVGFIHAGFGPSSAADWISTDTGVICAIALRAGCNEDQVAAGLVERAEEYLRQRGARTIHGGGLYPCAPFYLGLYGGSALPGLLDRDAAARCELAERGYAEIERVALFRRELSSFEPPGDRRQTQLRRQTTLLVANDVPTQTWWEAAVLGEFELTRFDLVRIVNGQPLATAVFRGMAPGGVGPGGAVGLLDCTVQPDCRRRGVALCLISAALEHLFRLGVARVEAQVLKSNGPALAAAARLGFTPVEEGGWWRKEFA